MIKFTNVSVHVQSKNKRGMAPGSLGRENLIQHLSVGMTRGEKKTLVCSDIGNDRKPLFPNRSEGANGKIVLLKFPAVSLSLLAHPLLLLELHPWQKAKTLLFCWRCCKSQDTLSCHHHRHQGHRDYPTETLVSTAARPLPPEPEQVAPSCGAFLVTAATAPLRTLPEQDLKSLGFCCLRNQPGGSGFFSPALQYACSVFNWKNLIRRQGNLSNVVFRPLVSCDKWRHKSEEMLLKSSKVSEQPAVYLLADKK